MGYNQRCLTTLHLKQIRPSEIGMPKRNPPTGGVPSFPARLGGMVRHAISITAASAVIVGLLGPAEIRAQEVDPEILPVLADMLEQQHAFKAARLHAMGVEGLSAVLDYLLPETADPKSVDLSQQAVAQLIAQLGHENYRARQTAFETLHQLGRGIQDELMEAARDADPEIRWRARRILRMWEAELGADKRRYAAN